MATKTTYFKVLEDTRDLSSLEAIATEGTHKAYIKAVETSDVIEVRDGNLVRKLKNGTCQIISRLEHRRGVQKGKTFILSNE